MILPSMFGEALKNLFSKPFTHLYPFEEYKPIKDTRGRYMMDYEKCIHCGLCERNCPAAVIKVDREKKRNEINISGCILCYRCQDVCPKNCIYFREQYAEPTSHRTLLVYEMLPKGEKPPKGADIEEKKKVEGGTIYVYKIKTN